MPDLYKQDTAGIRTHLGTFATDSDALEAVFEIEATEGDWPPGYEAILVHPDDREYVVVMGCLQEVPKGWRP